MDPDEFARRIMVLGYFAYQKWDDARAREDMSAERVDRFDLPEGRVLGIETDVARAFFREYSVTHALETYRRELRASKPSFWSGVVQNLFAAFLYTIIIAGILFAAERGALDLPGIEIRTTPTPSETGAKGG